MEYYRNIKRCRRPLQSFNLSKLALDIMMCGSLGHIKDLLGFAPRVEKSHLFLSLKPKNSYNSHSTRQLTVVKDEFEVLMNQSNEAKEYEEDEFGFNQVTFFNSNPAIKTSDLNLCTNSEPIFSDFNPPLL